MPATFEIGSNGPPGFVRKYDLLLQIQYEIDPAGVYIFSYKSRNVAGGDPDRFAAELQAETWKVFREGKLFVQAVNKPKAAGAGAGIAEEEKIFGVEPKIEAHINIPIANDDTTVYIETVGTGNFKDFYWSDKRPALMTARKRDRAYANLEYWNNQDWTPAIPRNDCRRIRFNARYNGKRSLYSDRNHGFGLNVRLRDEDGRLISLLIDPDIQNPSV